MLFLSVLQFPQQFFNDCLQVQAAALQEGFGYCGVFAFQFHRFTQRRRRLQASTPSFSSLGPIG